MSIFHLGTKYVPTKKEKFLIKKFAGAMRIVADIISKNYGLNIYNSDQIYWDYESKYSNRIKFYNMHGVCLCEIRKA